ncbi:MAG: class I SAM-dependent methyltransferase [Promethearchaeota archaeon]|nr:MAG: class I SAM-dependent methyltransferase [Candidatus Lokiarchaeota archaeon]
MYEEIIPFLKCPYCNNPLDLIDSEKKKEEIVNGKLKCNCEELWEIRDGVLDFRVEEQESVNRWSELTKEMSFEELDEMILKYTPQNQKEISRKSIEDILDYLKLNKPKIVIDIATGRGSLLNELVKQLKSEFHLVCIDLSFVVLKADREKIKKFNPKIKVSFVSCDATNLPFFENCFDLALSLMGIANMRDLIFKALKETCRVLKPNHHFLNSTLIVELNSKGYEKLEEVVGSQVLKTYNKYLVRTEVINFHKKAGFREAVFKMSGESIGQKNELDLLPFEGEWFAIGNIYAKK